MAGITKDQKEDRNFFRWMIDKSLGFELKKDSSGRKMDFLVFVRGEYIYTKHISETREALIYPILLQQAWRNTIENVSSWDEWRAAEMIKGFLSDKDCEEALRIEYEIVVNGKRIEDIVRIEMDNNGGDIEL